LPAHVPQLILHAGCVCRPPAATQVGALWESILLLLCLKLVRWFLALQPDGVQSDLPNLSIPVGRGRETKRDCLSNGE